MERRTIFSKACGLTRLWLGMLSFQNIESSITSYYIVKLMKELCWEGRRSFCMICVDQV